MIATLNRPAKSVSGANQQIPSEFKKDMTLIPGFISDPQALFEVAKGSFPWQGDMKARSTASFGVPYQYSHVQYPESTMPAILDPIITAIERAAGFRPNNCLANFYANGSNSMGYHSDDIRGIAAGTGVAIVTLGAERPVVFRNIQDHNVKHEILLPRGSLFVMSRELQENWQHAVPKLAKCDEPRISLTFRKIPESEE